jgi:hypothetical protein
VLYTENTMNVVIASDILKAEIEALDLKFAALPDGQLFTMKNGVVVTGAELKAWWDSLDFRVTDREFSTGSGAVLNGISNINWDALGGWSETPNGLSFIILHELTHSSPLGTRYNAEAFGLHRAFGGTRETWDENAFWFDVNEEFANWGAAIIMMGLGIPIPTGPIAFGFDDTMTAAPFPEPPPINGGSDGGNDPGYGHGGGELGNY